MRKAIVIDLDGTLLRTNTFRDYIRYSCREAFSAMQWWIGLLICLYAILRLLRLASHAWMKYHILRVTQDLITGEKLQRFVDQELTNLNLPVVDMLATYTHQDYLSILATAAPENYAACISSRLSFDDFCCTQMPLLSFFEWKENKSEEKLQGVLALLQKHNAQLAVVVTDHDDDRPLLEANQRGKNIIIK